MLRTTRLFRRFFGDTKHRQPFTFVPPTEEIVAQNTKRLQALNQQIQTCFRSGEFGSAFRPAAEAVEMARKTFSEDHVSYASAVNNLAMISKTCGDMDRANKLFEHALYKYTNTVGEKHPSTANVMVNLALVLQQAGNEGSLERAQELLQQAVAVREQLFGVSHASTASCMAHLGSVFCLQGKTEEAESIFRAAKQRMEETFSPEQLRTNLDYASVVHNLGFFRRQQKEYMEAEELLQEAVDIRDSLLGRSHPAFVASINALMGLYEDMHTPHNAQALMEEYPQSWSQLTEEAKQKQAESSPPAPEM